MSAIIKWGSRGLQWDFGSVLGFGSNLINCKMRRGRKAQ
jgi:hypothetical protein